LTILCSSLQLTTENDELSSNLHITRENQRQLAGELADLKDRYAEVLSLLRDTQEQLRRQRRKGMPQARGGLFSLGTAANPDSIASELESSLYSELSLDSGIGVDHRERM
jgi:trafficking kinesin-binding protein 1